MMAARDEEHEPPAEAEVRVVCIFCKAEVRVIRVPASALPYSERIVGVCDDCRAPVIAHKHNHASVHARAPRSARKAAAR
jgi:hypothetical protein